MMFPSALFDSGGVGDLSLRKIIVLVLDIFVPWMAEALVQY